MVAYNVCEASYNCINKKDDAFLKFSTDHWPTYVSLALYMCIHLDLDMFFLISK